MRQSSRPNSAGGRENFETGLRKTVEWYLANRDWWQPLRQAYTGQRLGVLEPAADKKAG